MSRKDDGYEQMMRIEDPYSSPPDPDLDALRLAEAQYGAVGTGNLGDVERKHEAPEVPGEG
jgi:hypothetical protein